MRRAAQRRPGRDLGGAPRHPRGVGARRRVPRRPGRARWAAGARAWSTTPSTCVLPDGSDAAAGGHRRRGHRVPAGRGPGAPRRRPGPHRPGGRSGPRTPPSGWSGSTPSPGTPCSALRTRTGSGCLRAAARSTTSPADGVELDPAVPGRHAPLGPNAVYDAAHRRPSPTQSYVQPAGLVRRRPRAPASAPSVHRQEAPGPRPVVVRLRAAELPGARRHPVPVTLVRHRDTPLDGTAPALLYGVRRLRGRRPSPSGTRRCRSCSTAAWSSSHAHVRGGGEGGRRWWLDGRLEHKQNTFTDHVAVADGLRRRAALVDGARIATRGLSAGGLLQGAVFSQRPDRWRARRRRGAVRRRGDDDVRRLDPADRHRVGRVGRPAPARRSSTGCWPTRRTTTRRPPAAAPTCWSPARCTTPG